MIAEAPAAPAAFAVARAAPARPAQPAQPLRWRRDLDTPPALELRWTPDGKLLAYSPADAPGVVTFLDPTGPGEETFSLGGGGPVVIDGPPPSRAFALSPDGRRLALPMPGGKVRLWDVESREVERTFGGIGEEIRSLAFDQTGRWLATGGVAYGMALWEVAKGKLVLKHAQPARINTGQGQLAFSTDQRWLIGAGDDFEFTLWRVPSLALTTAIDGRPSTSFKTDGRLVVYRDRNGLRLWDLTSGKREVAGPYSQVAVRPGGKHVLARGDAGNLVWIETGSRRARPTGLTFSLPAEAAFSPDGKTLAIARGSSRGIRLYDVRE